MATKKDTTDTDITEPRAVVETSGYYYILPIEDALEMFKLLNKAERADKDWGNNGYKKTPNTSNAAVLQSMTIAQYTSYKLTLND